MKTYSVCINKILFIIFPCVEREIGEAEILGALPGGSYAIVIHASSKADFSAESYDSGGRKLKEPHFCLAALSFFFKTVRGLPLKDLEIEFDGRVYNLDISVAYTPCFTLNSLKSKIKLAKTILLEDKTEVLCYDICGTVRHRVLTVPSAESVRPEYLRSLLVRDGCITADVVIAASYDGAVEISATDFDYPLEYVTVGVAALLYDGYELTPKESYARLLGGIHSFSLLGDKIAFIPEIKPLW